MRPKSALLTALLVCAPLVAVAHFPILSAPSWTAKKGEQVVLEYSFGHPYEVQSAAVVEKPTKVLVYPPTGEAKDLTATLEREADGKTFRFAFTPTQRGDHLIVVHSTSKHGEESLEDFTKLTLNVSAVQRGWDRSLGLPLEILPWTRPYGLPVGVALRAQALRSGSPLGGATVEIEYRNVTPPGTLPPEATITRVEKTEPDGMFTATLDKAGWWIISTSREADGRHVRGNLWVWVGP